MTHNTDHIVESTREDEQAEEAGSDGGIRLVKLVEDEGLGVVDSHLNAPIAQPA